MPIEHAIPAYESIDNYILQILLYTLAATITSLVGAVIYLFRYFGRQYESAIDREREMTEALTNSTLVLTDISEQVSEIKKKIGA